jgi:hypothetical protein
VVLRAQGVIAPPAVSTKPVDDELRRYDVEVATGAVAWSRDYREWFCRKILHARFFYNLLKRR